MISWEPETPTMSYLKWEETGRMLGEVDVAMKWWIADWVRWGEDRYGEKFAQALEGTQKDEKTLLTWLRVARSVAPDHRRWELTFSHHLVIAPLEPDQQSYWLQKAIDGDVLPGGGREAWSSRRLAAELKKLGQLSEAAEVEVEVIDKILVPDEYLIVDIKAVREAYATSHEEIPGLRISDPNQARCRGVSCGAMIGWITTTAGKPMPVDPELIEEWLDEDAPSGKGERMTLITDEGQTVTGTRRTSSDPSARAIAGYVPHWSTCAARTQFRTARRRPVPPDA
jgi:hypothetical protein